jgi:hypothetical protein
LNNLSGFDGGAVEDPGGVKAKPGSDPGDGEASENGVTQPLVLRIDAKLCTL